MAALFFFAVTVAWLFVRQYYTAAVMMLVPLAFSALWLRPEEVTELWPYFDPIVTVLCIALLGVLAGVMLVRIRNLVVRFVLTFLFGLVGTWVLMLAIHTLLSLMLSGETWDSAFDKIFRLLTTASELGVMTLIAAVIGGLLLAIRRH